MSHRTLVLTVVQLESGTNPAMTLSSSGPGVVGKDVVTLDLRLPMPEDVTDSRDWVRQVLAAACESV